MHHQTLLVKASHQNTSFVPQKIFLDQPKELLTENSASLIIVCSVSLKKMRKLCGGLEKCRVLKIKIRWTVSAGQAIGKKTQPTQNLLVVRWSFHQHCWSKPYQNWSEVCQITQELNWKSVATGLKLGERCNSNSLQPSAKHGGGSVCLQSDLIHHVIASGKHHRCSKSILR